MNPLISKSDESLLTNHQISFEIDETTKSGVIVINQRRLNVKILSQQSKKDSWKKIDLKQDDLVETAKKVALMLIKKELLNPKQESLDFTIKKKGIQPKDKDWIAHTNPSENAKDTTEDYDALLVYLFGKSLGSKSLIEISSSPQPIKSSVATNEKPSSIKEKKVSDQSQQQASVALIKAEDAVKQELRKTNDDLDRVKLELEQSRKEKQDLNDQLEDLTKQLAFDKSAIEKAATDKDLLAQEREKFRIEKEEVEGRLLKLEDDLKNQQSQIQSLTENKVKLTKEIEKLERAQSKYQELKTKWRDKVKESENIQSKFDQLNETLQDLQKKISDNQAKIDSLSKDNSSLLDEATKTKAENEKLSDDLKQLKNEQVKTKRDLDIKSKEVDDARSEMQRLSQEKIDLRNSLQESQIRIEHSTKAKSTVDQQIENLSNQITSLEKEKSEIQGELEVKTTKLVEKESEFLQINVGLMELVKEIEDFKKSNKALEDQERQLLLQVEKYKVSLKGNETRIKSTTAEVEKVTAEIAQSQSNNAVLKQQLEIKNQEIQQLKKQHKEELATKVQETQTAHFELKTTYDTHIKELSRKVVDFNRLVDDLKILRRMSEELKKSNEFISLEKEQLVQKIESLKTSEGEVQQKILVQTSALNQSGAEISQLKKEIAALNDNLKAKDQQIEQLIKDLEILKAKLSTDDKATIEERQKSADLIKEKEKEIQSLKQQVIELKDEVDDAFLSTVNEIQEGELPNSSMDFLDGQIEPSAPENSELEAMKKKYDELIGQMDSEKKQHDKELNEVRKAFVISHQENEGLRYSLDQKALEIESLNKTTKKSAANEDLVDELKIVRSENDRLKLEQQKLSEHSESTEKKYIEVTNSLATTRSNLVEQQKQFDKLSEEKAQIKTTASKLESENQKYKTNNEKLKTDISTFEEEQRQSLQVIETERGKNTKLENELGLTTEKILSQGEIIAKLQKKSDALQEILSYLMQNPNATVDEKTNLLNSKATDLSL